MLGHVCVILFFFLDEAAAAKKEVDEISESEKLSECAENKRGLKDL